MKVRGSRYFAVHRFGAWTVGAAAVHALLFIGTLTAMGAEAPPLPPGLDAPKSDSTPALPEGLGKPAKDAGPALPEGLGDGQTKSGPALPKGVESSGPELPPGLGEGEQKADSATAGEGKSTGENLADRIPSWLHGFWEARAGIRTQEDPVEPADAILGETRLQLKLEKSWNKAILEFTGDVYGDAVLEEGAFDLRQLRLTWRPLENVDIRMGRQILTWGTGDLLFINDLFPKDWQSFFIGRDTEYLKAPTDAIKIGWYHDFLNVEFVYTPQFVSDRFITGERISYWDPMFSRFAGQDDQVDYNAPSDWFEDDEFAVRLYRSIGSYELAFYGYSGYWKSPAGQHFPPLEATFPKLNVYGASLRGNFLKGIGNVEVGYYDSRQDRSGSSPFISNSEFRLLLGYEQELAKNLTGGIQYYLEHMMDYDAYRSAIFTRILGEPRDEDRHVVTVRLTKLLMNQNLRLSLFAYCSPSDSDAYLRPNVNYKVNDHWSVEAGGNVFFGAWNQTFFGQFENNTNVYASVRFSF